MNLKFPNQHLKIYPFVLLGFDTSQKLPTTGQTCTWASKKVKASA